MTAGAPVLPPCPYFRLQALLVRHLLLLWLSSRLVIAPLQEVAARISRIDPDDGEDAGTLMRQADLAMYKAKESGGATWVLFSLELSERL